MDTPRRFQPRLVGLTAGVILALLIWPATGWIVRSHLTLAVPAAGRGAPWSLESHANAWDKKMRGYEEAAARRPDDYALQLSAAINVPPPGEQLTSIVRVRRLRELTKRFPDRAGLYASILRFATQAQVHIHRDEEAWLTAGKTSALHRPTALDNTPEQIAAFDRDAAEGERLDPDNAYLPLMRSAGLFAAHRDADALAALERASRKPEWREYYGEEAQAAWKLHEEAYGRTGALPRLAAAYAILFPHYRQMRAVSRVAVAKAAEAERDGRVEEGLAIRDAVRRCGRLMRIHSTSAIGSVVGISMTETSVLRPGGAPPLPENVQGNADRAAEEGLRTYVSFLRQTGHTERIPAVEEEAAAITRVRATVRSSHRTSPLSATRNLVLTWAVALVPLTSAIWMLALGGVAALLARHRSIRGGKGWARVAHPVGALGLLFGGLLIFAALQWQAVESASPLVEMVRNLSEPDARPGSALYVNALYVGVAGAIPGLALLFLGALSLLWRVPLSVGVIRGIRGLAVPMACVLLLAYAVLIPFVARQEAALDEALNRTVQHEGRYLAELAGEKWPE